MNLLLEQVALLCNGKLSCNSNKDLLITDVTISSKDNGNNKLFIALKGNHVDGNNFIKDFIKNKSCAAITSLELSLPNLIIVEDTLLALELLAKNYHQLFNPKCVIITGSNGKTTVKNLIRNICVKEYGSDHVHATEGNYNNHIGLPLTLLGLNSDHKILILEAGMNHAGELDKLTKIAKPDIAIVINVFLTHIAQFNDINDIADAKFEIYNGLSEKGFALINQKLSYADQWASNLKKPTVVFYGNNHENSLCYIRSLNESGAVVSTAEGDINFKLKILGMHNYDNALAAISVCLKLGCSLSSIKNGLEDYSGYKRRLELKIGYNNINIIDDTYNSSLSSVLAAILSLKKFPKPHWAIIGDCLEVGKYEVEIHEKIADIANENDLDFLITYGQSTKYTHHKFHSKKKHFQSIDDIVKFCYDNLPINATVLVKGSNSMNLDLVVNKLVK